MTTLNLRTLKRFSDSSDPGDPECTCSLCGGRITEDEIHLRIKPDKLQGEYRFCEACTAVELE